MAKAANLKSMAIAALVVAAPVLTACGGGGGTPTGVYVGKVSGTDAYLALVSDGRQVGGYFCDGKDIVEWVGLAALSGDGHAELRARANREAIGSLALTPAMGSGVVKIEGVRHAFTVARARGAAGLYRGLRGTVGIAGAIEAGWVVLADGTQRGALDPRSLSTLSQTPETTAEQLTTRIANVQIGEVLNTDPEQARRTALDLGAGLPSLPIVKVSRPSLVITPKLKPAS